MNLTNSMTEKESELSKKERARLISKIKQASGIAQYALEEKLTNAQVTKLSKNLEILSLVKSANNYNRYCQGQKTAKANAKLKEFTDLKNSELYQAGKWLFNALSQNEKERKESLLEKNLVHKEDYNQDIAGIKDVVIVQKEGLEEQNNNATQKIKALENKIDILKGQLSFVQDYIINNYGRNRWKEVSSYIQSEQQQGKK